MLSLGGLSESVSTKVSQGAVHELSALKEQWGINPQAGKESRLVDHCRSLGSARCCITGNIGVLASIALWPLRINSERKQRILYMFQPAYHHRRNVKKTEAFCVHQSFLDLHHIAMHLRTTRGTMTPF